MFGWMERERELPTSDPTIQHSAQLDSRPQDDRVFGMPTLRKDKRPPAVRSVSDRTNYGDDGDAKLLLSPSIFTAHAVDPSTPLGRAEVGSLRLPLLEPSCCWCLTCFLFSTHHRSSGCAMRLTLS